MVFLLQALGAEELKGGIDPIRSLLKATNFPILASNINEPHRLPTLRESYTFYRSGQNFTIIGYAPPQSSNNSTILAADIEYSDDLTTICDLTKRLQKTELKNVYVVGDSGYDRNKQIAEKCQFVDMLITGKNNTESNDTQSQYPEIIRNEPSETHKQTPILYISSPDKYLGYLYVHVTTWYDFVEYWDGKPRLLDHMIAPDPKMMQLVQQFKQQSSQQRSEYILARTKVHLEGRESICRTKDCNLGALLADSLVHCRANLHQGPLWTDTPIAIIYGGILQGSLVPRPNKTEIRYRDVDKVLPYNRRLVKLSLTGLQIYQVIGSAIQEGSGHFVQVSGLNIGFKVVQGKRIVTSATALCNNCTRLVYKQVYFHRQYGVITTESFVNGEEGFDFRLSNLSKKLSIFDKECFSNYIHSLGWICPKDTPRIQLESNSNVVNPFRVLFCFLCLVIH